jgi:Flp pilus assembly pilin Flp
MGSFFRQVLGDESGANAVEFALLSVIVFTLIFGGISGAWAWNTQQTLTHAAREGARYAATQPDPDNDPTNGWHAKVHERTREAAHGLEIDPDAICVWYEDGGPLDEPGPGDDHCFEDEISGPRVQVHVATPAQVFTAFLPEAWTELVIRSSAVAHHEHGNGE